MAYILSVFFFALGSILASFVLVVAERIYTGQSWHKGRSACNSCARELGILDLIPVLSYVTSRGRCRTCGSKVPGMYLLAELVLGTLFLLSYQLAGLTPALGALLASLVLLTGLVAYDLRHLIVPTGFSLPFIACALLYAILSSPSSTALGLTLMTAGSIGLLFFLFHVVSRGRAMGLGDAPVALGLALIAGPLAVSGLMYSFWVGGVIGIVILSVRRPGSRMNSEVPFVPFLACGFLLALFTTWDILYIVGIR